MTLRVVYVTQTPFLDTALNRMRALSEVVDLHLVLVLGPESWRQSFFDLPFRRLPRGMTDAGGFLSEALPVTVHPYMAGLRSAHLAVFDKPEVFHPRTVATSQSVARFVRRMRPDVVHVDDTTMRLAWGGWRLKRTPVVMTVHDPLPHSGEGGWRTALSRRLNYRYVDRFILQARWGVEPFSIQHRVDRDRIDVSLLGVCDALRDWCGPVPGRVGAARRPTVLFFGRMSPYKGIDVLVDAAPLIAGQVSHARVIVAGGPIAGYTPPVSASLPNGGSLEVIARRVPTDEAGRLLCEADVVVLPYRDASQSGVVLSAFAFGVPVVATRVGGLPEYVRDGENGLLVSPGDVAGLASAVASVLLEEGKRAVLHEGVAKSVATRFAWKRVATEHCVSYESAIEEHRTGRMSSHRSAAP